MTKRQKLRVYLRATIKDRQRRLSRLTTAKTPAGLARMAERNPFKFVEVHTLMTELSALHKELQRA